MVDGRPIGLIDVFDTRVRDYTVHLDLIRNVGRLLAGSFEKAMLVDRLERSNQDLRLLADSGLEFGASLDEDAVLRTAAERIIEVSGADFCDVYRMDGTEVEILLSVGSWDADPVGTRYPLADYTTLVDALKSRRPVATPDILHDERMTAMEVDEALKWGYAASLDVPLISHGDVIGFISLTNRETWPFANEELVVGLAQVAGQAIANAALYRQLDENLRRVALVSESALELTSNLDLRATLIAAGNRLCQSVGVDECEITVIEGAELHTLMRVAGGGVDEKWIGQRLALGGRRRDPRGRRDEAAGDRRVAARPAAHAGRAPHQRGLRAQELGHAAADRQGQGDRHGGARRERGREVVHADGAGHRRRHLPRGGARDRQRRPVRARAAGGPRDQAAQRHRGADGRQPRPRRGRGGGRGRARSADGVRRVRPAAARGRDRRHGHRVAPGGPDCSSGSRSTSSSRS